ncbi:MAG: hypothetical protein EXX96DRAFT_583546 [Benjaminiella poitrasii]|nr:MAG: hypothetical protein EXX96DRAFT_583546 [Benjaminiella poitrasii]
MRSAFSSVFKITHTNQTLLADLSAMKESLKAKCHSKVRLPTKSQLSTWDTGLLIMYI